MSPEEAQQNPPRRRGRPPGSKTTRTRSKRAAGGELITQPNGMVAELISKNRQLQRQVTKLSERAGASSTNKALNANFARSPDGCSEPSEQRPRRGAARPPLRRTDGDGR